jgi:hypothetical protein
MGATRCLGDVVTAIVPRRRQMRVHAKRYNKKETESCAAQMQVAPGLEVETRSAGRRVSHGLSGGPVKQTAIT